MKRRLPLLCLALVLSFPACSGNDKESFSNVDHDKDGKIIYEEAFFVFPDLKPQRFETYDANRDGGLNENEYAVLYAAEAALTPGAETKTPAPQVASQAAPTASAKPAKAPEPKPQPKAPAAPVTNAIPPVTADDLNAASIIQAPGAQPPPAVKTPAPQAQPVAGPAAPAAPAAPASTTKYVVAKGDFLTRIAQKHNVSVEEILKANPGLNPDKLRDGQELVIPGQ